MCTPSSFSCQWTTICIYGEIPAHNSVYCGQIAQMLKPRHKTSVPGWCRAPARPTNPPSRAIQVTAWPRDGVAPQGAWAPDGWHNRAPAIRRAQQDTTWDGGDGAAPAIVADKIRRPGHCRAPAHGVSGLPAQLQGCQMNIHFHNAVPDFNAPQTRVPLTRSMAAATVSTATGQ